MCQRFRQVAHLGTAKRRTDNPLLRDPVSVGLRNLMGKLQRLTVKVMTLQDAHYTEQILWRIKVAKKLAPKGARRKRRAR